jgi:hypothetical protein
MVLCKKMCFGVFGFWCFWVLVFLGFGVFGFWYFSVLEVLRFGHSQ